MIKQLLAAKVRKSVVTMAIVAVALGGLAIGAGHAGALDSAQGAISDEGSLERIDLAGTEWTLVALDDTQVPAGSEISAKFDTDRVAGTAGCNGYFAGYETEGDGLKISPMGMTMMMCAEQAMELEMAFSSALQAAQSYRVDADTLEIIYDGGSLIFTAS